MMSYQNSSKYCTSLTALFLLYIKRGSSSLTRWKESFLILWHISVHPIIILYVSLFFLCLVFWSYFFFGISKIECLTLFKLSRQNLWFTFDRVCSCCDLALWENFRIEDLFTTFAPLIDSQSVTITGVIDWQSWALCMKKGIHFKLARHDSLLFNNSGQLIRLHTFSRRIQ